jgi:hypothetical protein
MGHVYFSPDFGFPGSNAILDNLSRPFDPFEGPSTISLLSEDIARGNDAAFRGVLRMFGSFPQVREFRAFAEKVRRVSPTEPLVRKGTGIPFTPS